MELLVDDPYAIALVPEVKDNIDKCFHIYVSYECYTSDGGKYKELVSTCFLKIEEECGPKVPLPQGYSYISNGKLKILCQVS